MSHVVSPTTSIATVDRHSSPRSFRPWWRWLLTALAYPPAGYVAHAIAGPVDSVWAAILGGVVAGAGIGAAQWALLRRRGVSVAWIASTAAGLGAGLAVGAALVSYRTDVSSLVLMGAISGLAVGIAQGAALESVRRILPWSAATAALWAVGWTVTTTAGVSVDEQWVVFGIFGALALAFLQSRFIGAIVPAKAVTS